jgi:3-dehydroquinate synthase
MTIQPALDSTPTLAAADILEVPVPLARQGYTISIGLGVLERLGTVAQAHGARGRLPLITDDAVWRAWGERTQAAVAAAGLTVDPLVLDPGEGSKSFTGLERVLTHLLQEGPLDRYTPVVAFGGGVIGDLAGLAAALALRGVPYLQVPTTLLAMVDSAIGGKTAIDVPAGKNLVGAFYQPVHVLADLSLLTTLPARQWRAGYAEIIKYGLLGDAAFYDWCEAHGAALLAGDMTAVAEAVATSCRHKAHITVADTTERSGLRATLNLGHTFAHAYETALGYDDTLLHGEAVAIGMVDAFALSARLGLIAADAGARLAAHAAAVGLPTVRPADPRLGDHDRLINLMAADKKAVGGQLRFVLVRAIGQAFLTGAIDHADVRAVLDARAPPRHPNP